MAPREKITKDESLITPPGQPLRPAEVFSEDREIVEYQLWSQDQLL